MDPLPLPRAQPLGDAELVKLIGRRDPVILDIGCNDGHEVLRFLELFPACRVHAFEPDPRPRARFERTIRNSRAKLWPLAMGATDGEAEFHVSSGDPSALGHQDPARPPWDQSGSLRKPAKHLAVFPWVKFESTVRVQTMRLDTFAAQRKLRRVDFIWADVQGAEADLIAGATETLRITRFLYTEYNDTELYQGQVDLRGLLQLLPDFELVERFPNDVLLRNRTLR
ncbi:MAG: FkbM family methyltransferase [Planctomycetes bacterium]|nr:FkbM family methyltransferase [Planctomycetota bacterium]